MVLKQCNIMKYLSLAVFVLLVSCNESNTKQIECKEEAHHIYAYAKDEPQVKKLIGNYFSNNDSIEVVLKLYETNSIDTVYLNISSLSRREIGELKKHGIDSGSILYDTILFSLKIFEDSEVFYSDSGRIVSLSNYNHRNNLVEPIGPFSVVLPNQKKYLVSTYDEIDSVESVLRFEMEFAQRKFVLIYGIPLFKVGDYFLVDLEKQ